MKLLLVIFCSVSVGTAAVVETARFMHAATAVFATAGNFAEGTRS